MPRRACSRQAGHPEDDALGGIHLIRESLQLDIGLHAGQKFRCVNGPTQEVVVLGKKDDPEMAEVLRHFRRPFRPHRILAAAEHVDAATEKLIPLFAQRSAKEGVTVYICANGVCQAPIIGIGAVRAIK